MPLTIDKFKKAFSGTVSTALLDSRVEEVKAALRPLKAAVDVLRAIGADAGDHERAMNGLALQLQNTLRSRQGNADKYAALDEIKTDALAATQAAQDAARQAPQSQNGFGRLLLGAKVSGERASALRTRAKALLQADPTVLANLCATPAGREVMDTIIGSLDGKAKGTIGDHGDKDLVIAAIKARYLVDDLQGDMTTKALPRLYKLLGLVPERHTRENDSLSIVERHQANGDSDFGGGRLRLNCPRTGAVHRNVRNFDPDPDVRDDWKTPDDNVSDFDQVTLHELGHAVDESMNIMEGNRDDAQHGGWQVHTPEQVADIAAAHFDFYDRFQDDYEIPMLRKVLSDALSGPVTRLFWEVDHDKAAAAPSRVVLLAERRVVVAEAQRLLLEAADWPTPAKTLAMLTIGREPTALAPMAQEVLKGVINRMMELHEAAGVAVDAELARLAQVGDVPDEEDWTAILAHDALKWCQATGVGDAYKLGAAHARRVVIDGRVYVKKASKWASYLATARARGVSQYQFNQPEEWFAELYAAYYMGKLPQAHPDRGWFTRDVDEG